MNKKGLWLAKHILEIILALIGIFFLILLVTTLYSAHLRNKGLEEAKASLNHLIDEINAGKTEVNMYNPDGWAVASFEKESGEIPYQCLNKGFENCICICKPGNLGASGEIFYKQCDRNNNGVCLESNYNVEGNWITIVPSLILKIDYENKIITKNGI